MYLYWKFFSDFQYMASTHTSAIVVYLDFSVTLYYHFLSKTSLIPRFSCLGGEKRAWSKLCMLSLPRNLEICIKSALLH